MRDRVRTMAAEASSTSSIQGLRTLLFWQMKFHPRAFVAGILISFVPAVAGLALLGVAGWFITATALAGVAAVAMNVFTPSAVIRGLALVRTGGRYGERLITHDATFRFLTDLRCRIFSAQAQSAGDGRVWRSAGLLGRLTSDIAALDGVYLRLAVPTVIAVFVGLGVAVFSFWQTPVVALGPFLALISTATVATFLVRRRRTKFARRQEVAQEALRVRTVDLVAGRRDLAVYGGLAVRADAILQADKRLQEAEAVLNGKTATAVAVAGFGAQAAVAFTLGLACWQVAQGLLSLPMATAVLLLVLGLPDVLNGVASGYARIGTISRAANRAVAGTARAAKSAALTQDPKRPAVMAQSPQGTPALAFRHVTFRYPGAERAVLADVSLDVQPGEWLCIVGPSGCGKTTVSALASGLLSADDGEVLLNGSPVDLIAEGALRSRITVIGQRPALFHDTIAANLRIANPDASEADLWQALQAASLDERIARQDTGLETILGEGGLGLSGGEQRRLGLARAYLTRPDLFILDEMTEGLDHDTAQLVLQRFAAFRGDAAVLMIAHRSVDIDWAHRTFDLSQL